MSKKRLKSYRMSLSEALLNAFKQNKKPLRWVNEKTNRYYYIAWQKDLLGDWVVMHSWGGIDTRRGGIKYQLCTSTEQFNEAINQLHKRRSQHGYYLIREFI